MKVVSLSSSFVVEAAAAGKAWNRGNGFGGEAFKSLRWVAKKQWFPAPQAHHCDCSSLVRGVQKPPNKNHREWWWWRCFLVLLHYYSGLFCSAQLDYSNNRFSTCLLASVSDFLYLDTKMLSFQQFFKVKSKKWHSFRITTVASTLSTIFRPRFIV